MTDPNEDNLILRPELVGQTAVTPASRWRQWLGFAGLMLVFAVLGGLLGYGLTASDVLDGLTGQVSGWVLLAAFVLATFLATLGHELGHVIAGWLVGFRFLLLVVGPLRISRQGDGLQVGLNRSLSLMGGLAASVPTQPGQMRRRRAWQVAGGPIVSLLLAAVCLGLGRWLATAVPTGSVFLVVTGLVSVMQAVVTLLPLKNGGFRTDGGQLLQLARNTPESRLQMLVIWLQAELMAGTRPRDLDAALVAQALAAADQGVMGVSAQMIGYYHALDAGDAAGATEALGRALVGYSQYPAAFRPTLAAEAAYFAGRYLAVAEAARKWLGLARGSMLESHVQGRAEAAVLLAEGRLDAARQAATAALDELVQAQDVGTAVAEREWLQTMAAWPDAA